MFDGIIRERHQASQVYSVSTLNLAIRDQLEGQFFYCLVEGEVSNAAFPQSGHIYLNLKDDGAVIKAVIWRSQAMLYRGLIASGQKVRVTGKITVYAPRGEYQLIVSRVEEAGKGDLHLQFEALKQQLAREGLFNTEFKKEIPRNPKRIGIVTSKTAAALQDVLNVLSEHRPDIPLILYETKVQGENAGNEIAAAIARANHEDECDLLLVIRGGGSIEDLWAFNEEIVARAIFASSIPIITGIGHETDMTIADFVADLRAPTPSIAAKNSSQSRDELLQLLSEFDGQLRYLIEKKQQTVQQNMMMLLHRLRTKEPKLRLVQFQGMLSPLKERLREIVTKRFIETRFAFQALDSRLDARYLMNVFNARQKSLQELSRRLEVAMVSQQTKKVQVFMGQVEKLHVLSPLTTLLRGYSMVTNERGEVVKSITQVQPHQALKLQVSDGVIDVEVKGINLI